MFNSTAIIIENFVERLEYEYERNYGNLDRSAREILAWAGRMALERIGQSDALYHNVEHTIMVTLVGQEILRGRHLRRGHVTADDWLHVAISLLCHDIGYVRGVCQGDGEDVFSTGRGDEVVKLGPGATDAALTPYHVDRGIRFVRERFGGHSRIDAEGIARNIELTRFPVPNDDDHSGTENYSGLVRAADLIGQLADPNYLRKLPALFHEFEETGTNDRLGYESPADLRAGYPGFYWKVVHPYVRDALSDLTVTQEGRQWSANLYAHVFSVEHEKRDPAS